MLAMAIDRRRVLFGSAALAATAAMPGASGKALATSGAAFGASYKTREGGFAVGTLDAHGNIVSTLQLPARGHDLVVKPGSREAVVFARRPGRFAVAFDLDGKVPPREIASAPDRHFYGHGLYSSDGKLLFSTENDIVGGRGVLGVRDATNNYAPVGVVPSGGIGPHDVALLSDGHTLVVANGGIDTDPGGREPISLADMHPSLTYIDMRTGDLIERVTFATNLQPLSIRHLAIGARDTVVFGCQWAGDRLTHPQLVGTHRRGGTLRLMAIPDGILRETRQYIGSVSVDASGEIAAVSAPRGNLALFFDIDAGRYLGAERMADVCGIAGAAAARSFALSSGDGSIRFEQVGNDGQRSQGVAAQADVHWDNHLVAF